MAKTKAELEAEIDTLQRQIISLQHEVAQQEAQIQTKMGTISDLQEKVELLEKELESSP